MALCWRARAHARETRQAKYRSVYAAAATFHGAGNRIEEKLFNCFLGISMWNITLEYLRKKGARRGRKHFARPV